MKVTERLDRVEGNQEGRMEELSAVLHRDEPCEPVVRWDTADEDQDDQNSLLEGLIKLVSSQPASSSVSAVKTSSWLAESNSIIQRWVIKQVCLFQRCAVPGARGIAPSNLHTDL